MKKTSDSKKLEWVGDPKNGYGFYPVTTPPSQVYDSAYHEKYVGYMKTKLGHDLNLFRVGFVEKFWSGDLLDVGCAAGHFMMLRGLWRTKGYEVNQISAEWLLRERLFQNPFVGRSVKAASFFDTLEHLPDPKKLLDRIESYVFVSIPVFKDRSHVLSSRHFRPTEHFFYFTTMGFINWMKGFGWKSIDFNSEESKLGREDIQTFAFRRF